LHADEPASSIDPGELAFINPVPWRTGEGIKWTGRVNFDLKSQRGNTDKDEFEGDAELGMRRRQDRFPLYMGIVASTEAEIEYDGGAPDGVDKTDTTCRNKLGYQW